MQVYSGGYGNGTIFVSPGAHDPDRKHEEWFVQGQDESGKDVYRPVQFKIKFTDGSAEVPDALGRYMVAEGLAKSSPVQMVLGAVQSSFDALSKIVYKKPIAVGCDLSEVIGKKAAERHRQKLRHNAAT